MTLEELKEKIKEVPTDSMTVDEYCKRLDECLTDDDVEKLNEDSNHYVERGYERINDLLNDYDCEHGTDLEDICAYVWDYDLAYEFLMHEIKENEENGPITGIMAALLTIGHLDNAYDDTYYYIDGYNKLYNFERDDLKELKAMVLKKIKEIEKGGDK